MPPNAKPEILILGYANADVVARVPRLPSDGERVTASEIAILPGGMAANCACAAASRGSRVLFFGVIGQGALGEMLESELARCGVDTTMAARVKRTTTAVVMVTPSGERAIISEPTTYDGARLRRYLAKTQGALLYIDGYHLVAALPELKRAKARGVSVYCDLDGAPDTYQVATVLEALTYVDIVQCNPQVAKDLFPQRSKTEAVAQLAEHVATVLMTDGAEPVLVLYDQKQVFVPVPRAPKPVDTTGAGDIFAGTFLHVYRQTLDVEGAVREAVAAATSSTRYPGTRLPPA